MEVQSPTRTTSENGPWVDKEWWNVVVGTIVSMNCSEASGAKDMKEIIPRKEIVKKAIIGLFQHEECDYVTNAIDIICLQEWTGGGAGLDDLVQQLSDDTQYTWKHVSSQEYKRDKEELAQIQNAIVFRTDRYQRESPKEPLKGQRRHALVELRHRKTNALMRILSYHGPHKDGDTERLRQALGLLDTCNDRYDDRHEDIHMDKRELVPVIIAGDWNYPAKDLLEELKKSNGIKFGGKVVMSADVKRNFRVWFPTIDQDCVRFGKSIIDFLVSLDKWDYVYSRKEEPRYKWRFVRTKNVKAVPHHVFRNKFDHDPIFAAYELHTLRHTNKSAPEPSPDDMKGNNQLCDDEKFIDVDLNQHAGTKIPEICVLKQHERKTEIQYRLGFWERFLHPVKHEFFESQEENARFFVRVEILQRLQEIIDVPKHSQGNTAEEKRKETVKQRIHLCDQYGFPHKGELFFKRLKLRIEKEDEDVLTKEEFDNIVAEVVGEKDLRKNDDIEQLISKLETCKSSGKACELLSKLVWYRALEPINEAKGKTLSAAEIISDSQWETVRAFFRDEFGVPNNSLNKSEIIRVFKQRCFQGVFEAPVIETNVKSLLQVGGILKTVKNNFIKVLGNRTHSKESLDEKFASNESMFSQSFMLANSSTGQEHSHPSNSRDDDDISMEAAENVPLGTSEETENISLFKNDARNDIEVVSIPLSEVDFAHEESMYMRVSSALREIQESFPKPFGRKFYKINKKNLRNRIEKEQLEMIVSKHNLMQGFEASSTKSLYIYILGLKKEYAIDEP